MTIAAIAVGDTDARAKMNLVITEANKVPGLEEVHLATINDARERPGDARPFFTEEIDGEASTATAIAIGTIETLADGKVLVIDSAAEPIIVARRENFAVEPGQVYAARWAIRRVQDSSDPLGDTVELGINWLDEDKATLSETIVESLSPSGIDGRLAYSATFSRDEDADETAPAGTRYARPFIRIYGGDARTAVEVIHAWRTAGLPGPKGDSGGYTYQTEALLTADTAPAINSIGYVVADATAALNGTYQKTAAAGVAGWTKIGELPWATSVLSFQDPVIFDIEGLITGSPVVFVPRQRYYWNGSAGVLATNGTESATVSGYVEISVSATTHTVIYFDASDAVTPYKSAVYPAGMPSDPGGRYKIIGAIWSRHIHCPFNFDTTDDWNDGRLLFRTPPVVDGSKLYIPSFYRWFPNTSTSLTLMSPADGAYYWALDISTSTTEERRHYFDLTAALAGSTPVLTAIGTAVPRMGGGRIHLIATSMNSRVTPRNGYQIAGGGNGGVIDNEYDFALGNDPDITPQLFSGTTVTTIADATLTALGFTRGFVSSGSNRPYAGASMKNPRLGYYFFGRAYYASTVDDTFATARVYLRRGTTVIASGTFNMTLEQKLSARARIYSVSGQIPTTGDIPDNYIIGMENAAGSVTNVCGIQFAVSPEPVQWIARGDYATSTSPAAVVGTTTPAVLAEVTPGTLALGDDLWLTQGDSRDLFLQNLFLERTEGATISGALWSIGPGGKPYLEMAKDGVIRVDPELIGATATFEARQRAGNRDRRWSKTVQVQVGPARASSSPVVHMIGDSWVDRAAGAHLESVLRRQGMTPSFIGTVPGKGLDGGDTTGVLGEGRGGWRYAHFTHENDEWPPLSIGDEAAYLLATKTVKRGSNPYIRAATGGDDPARVHNGHIFDFDFYLNRWAAPLPVPDVVVVTLCTNDIAYGSPEESIQWTENGLAAIVPSIREAAPDAYILLAVGALPRSTIGDAEWAERHPVIAEHIRYARASGDERLRVVPLWQHMSTDIGFYQTVVSTDPDTGVEIRDWDDVIHPDLFHRSVIAEVEASAIGGLVNPDVSVLALLARMTVAPSVARKWAINALVGALKTAGVWDKLDVLQVYAAHDEQAALLNWKADAINATNNGATFTADRGFAGDAVSTWVSNGFNPTSVAGQYALNSAHAAFWIETDGASTNGHGFSPGCYVRHATGSLYGRINDASTTTFGAASATGHHMLVRRGATDKRGFVNGVQIGITFALASTSIPDGVFGVGRWNGTAAYSDDRVSCFHAGASLTDGETTALYNALRAYMTGAGVA